MSKAQELKCCPFCGAGETVIHVNQGTWTGRGYGEPVSVEVRHWCKEEPGQPSRAIIRVGRDEESAIAAWNLRAPASGEQQAAQQDERNDALQDSAYAAGMLSGWNLCVADDHATFSRIRGERMTDAARVALAARASNGGKA